MHINTVMEVVKLVQNQQIHHGQITRLVHGLVIQVMQRMAIVAQHVQSHPTPIGQVVAVGRVIAGIHLIMYQENVVNKNVSRFMKHLPTVNVVVKQTLIQEVYLYVLMELVIVILAVEIVVALLWKQVVDMFGKMFGSVIRFVS